MWITMMVAMMLPTIVPVVLAHYAVAKRWFKGSLSTLAFVAGYLLLWSAIGIAAFLAYSTFAWWGDDTARSWLLPFAGEVFAIAGAYQFTRWKRDCGDVCRRPLSFVFTYDWHHGARNALRAGTAHGVYCLGCCWAAMTVLLVVGLTNLVWMTLLSALFFIEKNWTQGDAVAKAAGVGLMVLGVAIIAHPPLLAGISS
jgi:predicted metal-binding membrane protein